MVLTPSLNKSFKFQSEWPYNNSQSYLLQTILKDIKNDEERIFSEENGNYIFVVKANYSNNKNLTMQKIIFDKELKLSRVEIMNDDEVLLMKMEVNSIDMNATFADNYFTLKENMETFDQEKIEEPVSKIEEIIYPMYIPVNTYLSGQDQIAKDIGERVILTFDGEKPFMLVQETINIDNDLTVTPMAGEPVLLGSVLGAVTDNSVTWIDEDIEYYVVSDSLTKEELVSIATSVSVMPVGK